MKASESVERYDSEVRLYTNYAIKNIKKVCKDFGPRPVGSEAEKNAQLHMKKELESSCDTVTREEYKCSDKAFMAWVPLGAILILFSIVMFTLGIPVASLAASLVTLFIILAEFIFYKPVLDVFFPKKHPVTSSVFARLRARQRSVLLLRVIQIRLLNGHTPITADTMRFLQLFSRQLLRFSLASAEASMLLLQALRALYGQAITLQ